MASLHDRALPLAFVAVLLLGCGPGALPATPSPVMLPTQSPGGLTREQAIAAARAAVPSYANEAVIGAEVGTYAEMAPGGPGPVSSPVPPLDHLVWRVTLGENAGPTGANIAIILIDFWTGQLISSNRLMS